MYKEETVRDVYNKNFYIITSATSILKLHLYSLSVKSHCYNLIDIKRVQKPEFLPQHLSGKYRIVKDFLFVLKRYLIQEHMDKSIKLVACMCLSFNSVELFKKWRYDNSLQNLDSYAYQ